MGGTNEATCPPPSSSVQSRSPNKSASTVRASTRFHEAIAHGEVDFHDDAGGIKCAVDSATFFSAYNKWRPLMTEDLTLVGHDGSGGHASVTLMSYSDDAGEIQVSIIVAKAAMGRTVLDLDKLAHYS